MSRTPPGLMSGPAWRAESSYIISEALRKGPGVSSSSDTSGIPGALQGRLLGPLQATHMQVGPENGQGQSRKCLGPLSPEC